MCVCGFCLLLKTLSQEEVHRFHQIARGSGLKLLRSQFSGILPPLVPTLSHPPIFHRVPLPALRSWDLQFKRSGLSHVTGLCSVSSGHKSSLALFVCGLYDCQGGDFLYLFCLFSTILSTQAFSERCWFSDSLLEGWVLRKQGTE